MYSDTETGLILHRGTLSRSIFAVRLVQLLDVAFVTVAFLLLARFALDYAGTTAAPPAIVWLRHVTTWATAPIARIPNGHDAAGHLLAWRFVVALVACGVAYRVLVGGIRRMAKPRTETEES